MQSDTLHRIWQSITQFVDHLSVTKTAAIGSAGSAASIASAYSAGFDVASVSALFQMIAFATGAVGGVLSVGLLALKIVQQRREMRTQREDINILDRKVQAAAKWKGFYGGKDR